MCNPNLITGQPVAGIELSFEKFKTTSQVPFTLEVHFYWSIQVEQQIQNAAPHTFERQRHLLSRWVSQFHWKLAIWGKMGHLFNLGVMRFCWSVRKRVKHRMNIVLVRKGITKIKLRQVSWLLISLHFSWGLSYWWKKRNTPR